jgi:hypothetical protein
MVGTWDGSLVYATAIEADQDTLKIELANGLPVNGGNVRDLVSIQPLGGQLAYLSDLEPSDYRHVPYLNIVWPFTRDRNVSGGPLVVDGKEYWEGIGMHSASRLTYRLDGTYRRFDASVALDDSARDRGNQQWEEIYKSNIVRGGETPQPVSIDLRGAQGLTLTVDFADRGDELDHADWLDARLVR